MPLPENVERGETVAGGTTVGQESQRTLWIGLAALAVVGAGIAYAAMGKGEPSPSAIGSGVAEAPRAAKEGSASPSQPAPPATNEPAEVGISLDEPAPTPTEERARALRSFEESLNGGRLWTTLSVDGATPSTLSMVSGACSEEGMQAIIARAAKSLQDVGFSEIECAEKSGAQVFHQSL